MIYHLDSASIAIARKQFPDAAILRSLPDGSTLIFEQVADAFRHETTQLAPEVKP